MRPGSRRQVDVDAKITLRPTAVRQIQANLNVALIAVAHMKCFLGREAASVESQLEYLASQAGHGSFAEYPDFRTRFEKPR